MCEYSTEYTKWDQYLFLIIAFEYEIYSQVLMI